MKKNATKIAVVGATGLVGGALVKVLNERKIDAEYVLFNTTGGVEIEILGKIYLTRALCMENVKNLRVDFAFFMAGGEISREYAPIFADNGAIVIDNSSHFRMYINVPLVIPEVNGHVLKNKKVGSGGMIIANPNCSTIGALVPLKPLHDKYKLLRVIYTTFQAISGAGANPKFLFPITDNLIPFIAGEEEKMANETKKIFSDNDIMVTATCVRVPVRNCHTIAICAEFEKPVDINEVKNILKTAKNVVMVDEPNLPMPVVADNNDEVFVGRIRGDEKANVINFVTCSDNIRKGAATNAVQIFEFLTD